MWFPIFKIKKLGDQSKAHWADVICSFEPEPVQKKINAKPRSFKLPTPIKRIKK